MKLSRHSTAFGSVVLAVVIGCTSCGSSAPSEATLSQQLLAIVKSTNAALAKDTIQKHLAESNAKYSQAFAQAAREFHALQVPASAQHDDDQLVAALNTLSKDATAVSKAAAKNQNVEKNVLAYGQLNLKLMEEETTEKKASNALRHDLGLPPEATTTTQAPTALTTTTTKPPAAPPTTAAG
jgi:hypothetical protein